MSHSPTTNKMKCQSFNKKILILFISKLPNLEKSALWRLALAIILHVTSSVILADCTAKRKWKVYLKAWSRCWVV